MRAILTLQIPSDDLTGGRILAASSDPDLLRRFCRCMLDQRIKDFDHFSGDPFDRELARLEIEQLRARMTFALGEDF